jgi:hypothetical protein
MKIFISYRRDDSAGYAGRLFDYLEKHFGSQQIFMDVGAIQPGEDFRKAIESAVGKCDVVLVMIGKQWLSITDEKGQRRLDNPKDFVRAEIAGALANPKTCVIPVLVRNVGMPDISQLPDNLKDLTWRHAIELSDTRFEYDANKLIKAIEKLGTQSGITVSGKTRKLVMIFLALVLSFVSVFLLLRFYITPPALSEKPTPTDNIPTLVSTDVPIAATSTNVPVVATLTNVPTALTPTMEVVEPTATEKTLAPAVQTVQQYFNYINNAGIRDDLNRAWDLMTNKLQCNKSDQCNVEHYKDFWWKLQVQYQLFDCGSNQVAAKLIYYTRGSKPNSSGSPAYLVYDLLDENGELKLNSAKIDTGISTYCELSISFP